MEQQSAELLEKIRQQFDFAPYPRAPLEDFPRDIQYLCIHNLTTPYYLRNQKVIHPEGKVILDAACGTGYHTLGLQVANPGAKIVATDISEASVKLARTRLEYHGFHDVEFHALAIEDLPQLGLQFDYINADEVLYLVPDAVAALQAMKAVLKPDGIIRTNLHSSLQRFSYYRAQQVFKIMGLMDEAPGELEIGLVRETAQALKNNTRLKASVWKKEYETNDEGILTNLLLQGDKGFTVPQMFAALRAANLEFINMVNWQDWNLMNLFKESEKLPVSLLSKLPQLSLEERLHLFELLHSVHRLLDFWCGHPNADKSFVPVAQWNNADWQRAKFRLHPNINMSVIKQEIIASVNYNEPWKFSRYLPFTEGSVTAIEPTTAAGLLPLFDAPQTINNLVERWQKIKPVDPVTLNPREPQVAWEQVKQLLTNLEQSGLVLVEIQN
ncbi:class I SAM-dependent methyltransferase [Phormidium sp. LEGE 05292]|uniref:class I SAM-dependent methyltransferase n=1 Tax=[Phormidium] sp. LEGE 05292 TaxID=767427 RepID=UPI00187E51F8|nr:class I SAM-dependent methyltransferase [Phormidium sp. LEGE 05292]MBE9224307.1 class I SAM-dependent methyltransferase [Phormidium sp. LEGE 05292]